MNRPRPKGMQKDSTDEKFYCENPDCDNEIPEPIMCCSGRDCGCRGLPIHPPVCSQKCYDKMYGNKNVSHET